MKPIHTFLCASLFSIAQSMLTSAIAAAGDCPEDGGKSSCVAFILKSPDWKFDWCRTTGNAGSDRLWCERRGGTWDGDLGCLGTLNEITEDNFFQNAGAVELLYHGACDYSWAEDSGWGVTPTPNGCFNGGTKTKGGLEYQRQRSAVIATYGGGSCNVSAGNTWYVLQQTREVVCPPGAQETTTPSGRLVCMVQRAYDDGNKGDDKPSDKPRDDPKDTPKDPDPAPTPDGPPSCNVDDGGYSGAPQNFGNPMNVTAGSKESVETDYSSGAVGGLVFVRHYNSSGYFSLTNGGLETYSDYWRHTYSARVLEYPTNANALAAVQSPSGAVTFYNLSGTEIQNDSPGTSHLVRVLSGGVFTGWQQTLSGGDARTFDTQGRLVSMTTRAGFVTTLAYTSGLLTSITDMFGRSIALAYDGAGRLATMTDPSSRVTTYGYDAKGRLVTVARPDSTVRTYLYEDTTWAWQLTGVVDERSARVSTYSYSPTDGRAISTERTGPDNKYNVSYSETSTTATRAVTDAFGSNHIYNYSKINGVPRLTSHVGPRGIRSATYDTNGNVLTKTDRRNNVTTFVFDATRRLETSRTEAAGTSVARTIATTWHSTLDLPTQITQPSSVAGTNLVTTLSYDANGNLTSYQETAGSLTRQWTYTVDSLGRVLTVDGPRTDLSDVTTFTYFAANDSCVGCRGQVATITNASGHVTTFSTYNLDSKPLSVTDANGVASTYAYDARGRLASVTRNAESFTYEYDAIGHVKKVTLPDGSWVHYSFDEANALIGIDDSLGNAIDYELDVRGNIVKTDIFDPQDQLKRTMQRVYDGANRHVRDVGGLGQETAYQRDGNSNVTKITDPRFNVTTLNYDALDRLSTSVDPYNNYSLFTYDARDNLASVRDPWGLTTTYTRDAIGNRTQLASPDTGTGAFTYNAAGQMISRTDSRGVQTTYARDSLGRVTSAAVTDGQVDYEYDNTTTGGSYAKGRVTKVTDPSGNTQYQYDASGRVTAKTQTVGASPNTKTFVLQYEYSLGRLSSITLPSGRVVSYGFDANGRPSTIAIDATQLLSGAQYQPFGGVRKWTWANGQVYERNRDIDGRIVSATLGPDSITYDDLSQAFSYDNLNRLVSATLAAGQTRAYAYDANGNRTSDTVNATTTTYSYPGNSHRLTSLSGGTSRSFTYDNSGSVTSSASITYTYDGRGRMKQAGATSYLVNGLGQRVKKATPDVYFAYDEAGHLVGEYDSTGAPIQEFAWLENTLVGVIRPATTGYTFYYVWTDLLDTPRIITDTSNRARWTWVHDEPFGNSTPNENPASLGAFNFNMRLPGQYFDAETGLHYNYFRDYDPRLGRYVESDPIGLAGGSNTFGYVSGNPISRYDILGLIEYFGLGAIRDHLEDLARRQGDNFSRDPWYAAERAMMDRLALGKDTPWDLAFYHHEKAEARQCRAFRSLPDRQYLDKVKDIHDGIEGRQGNDQFGRYHPDVIKKFPDLFPPSR